MVVPSNQKTTFTRNENSSRQPVMPVSSPHISISDGLSMFTGSLEETNHTPSVSTRVCASSKTTHTPSLYTPACASSKPVVCQNVRMYETPQHTFKMPPLSPNVSPTTENKLFSGACVSLKVLDSLNGIDLNSTAFEAEYNTKFEPKEVATQGRICASHWSLNLDHPEIDSSVSKAFYDWLACTTSYELER